LSLGGLWRSVPQTVGIIGLGKLGSAIGLRLKERGFRVVGSVKTHKSLERARSFGLEAYLDSWAVVSKSDLVILSVKPRDFPKIAIKTEKPVISFMAGVPLSSLSQTSPRPFRAMTNLALTAVAVSGEYDESIHNFLKELSPKVYWVDESLLDPLTVVLGSGPAIVAELMRQLTRAAVNVGVPWEVAEEIIGGLFAATPRLVEGGGVEELVRRVATPGGTTIRALVEMSSLEATLARSIEGAVERARLIAEGLKRGVK
jgi:pyrroline-5-carboxylate reductase